MSACPELESGRHTHREINLSTYKRNEDPNRKERYDAGQPNSHQLLDSKDERSLSNTLAAAQKVDFGRVSFHCFTEVYSIPF